jgi:hypothetical protein
VIGTVSDILTTSVRSYFIAADQNQKVYDRQNVAVVVQNAHKTNFITCLNHFVAVGMVYSAETKPRNGRRVGL